MKSLSQHALLVYLLVLSCTIVSSIARGPAGNCIIGIQNSSPGRNSNCRNGSWDGFLTNNCCEIPFKGYLYGLAQRANQSGQIFLNSTEQNDCLSSMKNSDPDAFDCGIQKLTNGLGGCSDYSVTDVDTKLGNRLNSLRESCKLVGSDQYCNQCSMSWRGMNTSSNSSNEMRDSQPDNCRFAVLISLISQRINDDQWFQAISNCLEDGSPNIAYDLNDQASHGRKKRKLKTDFWILIGGVVGIAAIVTIACFVLLRKNTKGSPQGNEVSDNSLDGESSCVTISIKEVYSATNNLSDLNLIGQGIAGKVYKGILSDGQRIAVKHIINDGHMDTFVREVKSLSHIKHPNLVALIGHCDGDDECFLVYELCHNGNLSQWLFGKEKTLSWIQRLNIAIDCGRGLGFLHTYPGGCIVHRDIKPTNILICANFQAKLSDFGLSKVMSMGQSFVSSEVRGTFGYVDPEYRKNRHVNSSGDVYSFGIVLLQLLSGQRVINMDLQKPVHLNKVAKSVTRGGNMTEFADSKLYGDYSFEAFELVFKLALSCTGLKQQRPRMQQVVGRLEEALDISMRANSVRPTFYN
ncbi:probable serine/threonine-protein kinase PBL1 [Coffea arabica]|uniref:Probable serine/threonine-protein kinase PBL1 n=1 Tax=Coffea arabica TaxID=13443 RepID=A0ABM4WAN1_COFAR